MFFKKKCECVRYYEREKERLSSFCSHINPVSKWSSSRYFYLVTQSSYLVFHQGLKHIRASTYKKANLKSNNSYLTSRYWEKGSWGSDLDHAHKRGKVSQLRIRVGIFRIYYIRLMNISRNITAVEISHCGSQWWMEWKSKRPIKQRFNPIFWKTHPGLCERMKADKEWTELLVRSAKTSSWLIISHVCIWISSS